MPDLSMSQTTIPSTQGSFMSLSSDTSANKKRTYEDDIEDDMDDLFENVETEVTERRIAKLKSSHRRMAEGGAAVRAVAAGFDFEDAGFLAPMDVDDADGYA